MNIAVKKVGAESPKQQIGRPPKHNWAAEKNKIELAIKKGAGLGLLAKPYGMTPAGMRRVVRSLGLRTLGMKQEVGNDQH